MIDVFFSDLNFLPDSYITILITIFLATSLSAQYNKSNDHIEQGKCKQHHVSENRAIEAERVLMDNYDVKYMLLDIIASNTSTYHSGSVLFLSEVIQAPIDTFVFELNNHTIDSIVFEGQNLNYSRSGDIVFAFLPSTINVGELFETSVAYQDFSAGDGMSQVLP